MWIRLVSDIGGSDIGGSGKSEIDLFGISGFDGILEIDPFFYGIVTYFRWWKGNIPMTTRKRIKS